MGTVGGFLLGLGLLGILLYLIAHFTRRQTSATGSTKDDDERFLQRNMTQVVVDELRAQGFGVTSGGLADIPTRTARLGDLYITFDDDLCATCRRCLLSSLHEFWPTILPTMPPVFVTLRHALVARFCAFCGDVTKSDANAPSGVFGILLQQGTNIHRVLRREPGGESEAQLLRAIHDGAMDGGKTAAEVVALIRAGTREPTDDGGGGQNGPPSGGSFVH